MKFFYFFLFFSLLGISCCQQKNNKEEINYIPFENLKGNRVYVRAIINDSVSGLFLLDNGSKNSTIDSTFFYQNLPKEKYNISKPYGLWWQECRGDLKFTLGSHTFYTKYCDIKNLESLHPDLDGILGIDAFKNKITFIDFDSNKIAFVDTLYVPIDYHKIVLRQFKNKGYERAITVDSFPAKQGSYISGNFLFDLGASGGLSVSNKFINKIRTGERIEKIATGRYMMIKAQFKSYTYIIDTLYLSKQILLTDVPIHKSFSDELPDFDVLGEMLADGHGDGLLGIKILSQFNLIYDEKNNLLYLKARNK